jgi:hypothetical protein
VRRAPGDGSALHAFVARRRVLDLARGAAP